MIESGENTRYKRVASPYSLYQLAMLILCLVSIALVSAPLLEPLETETRSVLDVADIAICLLFFVDFLWSLWRAPDRWRYFLTWGWLDLLSSIPALDVARWGRLARVLRVLRVLRGLRTAKIMSEVILRHRAENGLLAACLGAVVLAAFASIAILQLETDPQSNIHTAEDALWWAISTMTTVGYGDRFPVTTEGRGVAVILMIAGVGLFSTFSAFLAAYFLRWGQRDDENELLRVREQMAALKVSIDDLVAKLDGAQGRSGSPRESASDG